MFEVDDIVIVKEGLRDPILYEPKVGVIIELLTTNPAHPEWNLYSVLIDNCIIDVPSRRLIKAKINESIAGQLSDRICYITNVNKKHTSRSYK